MTPHPCPHPRTFIGQLFAALIGVAFALCTLPSPAAACTRVVYLGPDGLVITGRTMDWKSDLGSNLWSFPRGMERDGAAGPDSLRWTSKHGSVVASAFEAATADGMNEAGLVASLLYLAESEYVTPSKNDARRTIAIGAMAQYVLDSFGTVAEVVDDARRDRFFVVPTMTPDGHAGSVHLAVSDPTGDSAIFEYVGGKLVIHHDRAHQVMTNSPVFEQQLALNGYWEQIGGTVMLPGTNRSADRFARASFYIKAIPQTSNRDEAAAAVLSVMRNVSVPLGISTPGQPNISSTLWRTLSDQKNRRYFFESTRTPNVFWVDLADLDFSSGAGPKKLTLVGGAIFAGNTASKFEPAEPFAFLAAELPSR